MPLSTRFLSIFLAFFLSGCAALVYQSTWGRLLHRVFGISDLAIATVLASFFLGLGLGSVLGGRWARKVKRPELLYAVFELAIGLFAFGSIWIIPRIQTIYSAIGAGAPFELLTVIRLGLAMVILLPPTILMGATLPILIAVLARPRSGWTSPATWLYATNTFGAVAGAGAAGLWLVPVLGTKLTITVAALLSIAAGALVAAFWWKIPVAESAPDEARHKVGPKQKAPGPQVVAGLPWLAVFLAGLTGFAALSGEVLWTRVLRYILQGTTQSFAAMLVNYLLGIAIGSLVADAIVKRGRSPTKAFAVTQLVLALLTVFSMISSPQLLRLMGLIHENGDLVPHEPWVILVVSAFLLLPIALMSGMSIPLAWRISGSSAHDAPRWAGRILASNTFGGLVGSLLAGFFLVPLAGIEASILVVCFIYIIGAAIALRFVVPARVVPRVIAIGAPLLLGVLILRLEPSLDVPYLLSAQSDSTAAIIRGPGETWREPVVFLEEGRNTTVHVKVSPSDMRMYNDGRQESGMQKADPGFGSALALLGGLPTFHAEKRDKALVIGLGAGHTVTTMLAGGWKQVEVVELEPAVVNAARFMHKVAKRPFPIDDSRARLHIDDARAFLVLTEPESYDAIVSQPSHPWLAGSSALYTREFFEETRRALKPGGIVTIWVNLFRIQIRHVQCVMATFQSVFPNVNVLVVGENDLIIIGSNEPLELNERVDARMGDAQLQRVLGPLQLRSGLDLVRHLEMDSDAARDFAAAGEVMSDDRPLLEFELARVPSASGVSLAELDEALLKNPWLGRKAFAGIERDRRVGFLQKRIVSAFFRPKALQRVELSIPQAELTEDEVTFLQAMIAERTGQVEKALGLYDRVENPVAAASSDELRFRERRFDEIVERAARSKSASSNPYYVVAASLMTGRQEAVGAALESVKAVFSKSKSPINAVAETFAAGGCPAVVSEPGFLEVAASDEAVSWLGLKCSLQQGREELATSYSGRWMHARIAKSHRETSRAKNCFAGGNFEAAVVYARYALSSNPSNALAAKVLARAYQKLGRTEEAMNVLERASRNTKGLPTSGLITKTAKALGGDFSDLVEQTPSEDSFATTPQMEEE